MTTLAALLGTLPLILLFAVLLFSKRGLVFATAVYLGAAASISTLYWRIVPSVLLGSLVKGFLVSLDILLIVVGALLFMDAMKRTRILSSLEHYLQKISPDSRVQAIIIAWFFGSLLEGSAGFGTPPVVTAPILVGLGFAPLSATSIVLLANTVPVSFGAVGTPVEIGFGTLASHQVSSWVGAFGAILSVCIPLFLLGLMRTGENKKQLRSTRRFTSDSALPFAIWSGIIFGICFFFTSRVNTELPSILAGIGGIVLTMFFSRFAWWRKLILPRETLSLSTFDPNHIPLHPIKVITPYTLLVLALALSKNVLPSLIINLPGGMQHKLSLANPGLILTAVALPYFLHAGISVGESRNIAHNIGNRVARTASMVVLVVAATQLLVNSSQNYSGLPPMLHGIQLLIFRENVGIISPLIGMLGAFVAGSVTVSNLMFAQLQWQAAMTLGTSATFVLGLQIFGATAGNAMSLASTSAVSGALGLHKQERAVLKGALLPVALYTLLIILIAALLPPALIEHIVG